MAGIGTVTPQVGAHDEAHELTEIEKSIMTACARKPCGTQELLSALGYRTRTGNFKNAVAHLIGVEMIERTVPDAARSKNQKYRLTVKGQTYLVSIQKEHIHRPSRILER